MSQARFPTRKLVSLPRDPSGCWEWIGNKTPNGYGKKQFAGHTHSAHRWIWQLLQGPIPDGMVIDHVCQNRACVNPQHLRVVTQAENVRAGLTTTLTLGDAEEIRAMWRDGWQSPCLAERFGVTAATIKDIVRGKSWNKPQPFYGAHANMPKDKAA